MRLFSIPYNGDTHLLDKIFTEFPKANGMINEIFLAMPKEIIGTGRVVHQNSNYNDEMVELIKKADKYGIESNILLNPGCSGDKMADADFTSKCINYLNNLKNEVVIKIITVSDFVLAKEIKGALPEIKLECSSVAYVDSIKKAAYWREIGCDILVVPPDLNKDIEFIKDLKDTFPEMHLKIIVNQDCIPGCPMRMSHNNIQGHGNDGKVYLDTCEKMFVDNPWLFYSSTYIPPAQLCYYDEYISFYKLIDRKKPTEKIFNAVGAYCGDTRYEQKASEWNQRIPDYAFKMVLNCKKDCLKCDLCRKVYNDQSKSNKWLDEYIMQLK